MSVTVTVGDDSAQPTGHGFACWSVPSGVIRVRRANAAPLAIPGPSGHDCPLCAFSLTPSTRGRSLIPGLVASRRTAQSSRPKKGPDPDGHQGNQRPTATQSTNRYRQPTTLYKYASVSSPSPTLCQPSPPKNTRHRPACSASVTRTQDRLGPALFSAHHLDHSSPRLTSRFESESPSPIKAAPRQSNTTTHLPSFILSCSRSKLPHKQPWPLGYEKYGPKTWSQKWLFFAKPSASSPTSQWWVFLLPLTIFPSVKLLTILPRLSNCLGRTLSFPAS